MDRERRLLAALDATVTYELGDGTLALSDALGVRARFVARADPA